MNKLLQKVAKIFLGVSMAAGVGVAASAGRKNASAVSAATTASITFGTTAGNTFGSSSKTGSFTDTQSNSWNYSITIGTLKVSSGTNYAQIGNSSNKPSNVTFTWTLGQKWKITAMSIGVCSSSGSGSGSVTFTAGGNDVSSTSNTYSGTTATTISKTGLSTEVAKDSTVVFNVNTNNTQVRFYTLSVTYEAAATSDVLSSVSSSNHTTSFADGDTFSYGGTLTATYNAGTASEKTNTVTPTSFAFGNSGIDPTSAGTAITTSDSLSYSTHDGKYIYVIYTEGTTKWDSYQISVSEPITVSAVTGIATSPSTVVQNGTISASLVTLNVRYSDNTTGTEPCDHVNVTTSGAIGSTTTATAWYTAAETDNTKKATFTVTIIAEPLDMHYTGSTTDNVADGEDGASLFNLTTSEWTAICHAGSANAVGYNQAGDIRLYYNANGSNYIVVKAKNASWQITSITVDAQSSYSNYDIYAGESVSGQAVSGSNHTYQINNQAFVIHNANTSSAQVRINHIYISYQVLNIPVTGVSINDGIEDHSSNYAVSLYEGTEATYTATVTPAGAEQGVTWTSTGNIDNEDGYFVLGAYAEGTSATLTATSVGTKSDSTHASVTVTITILQDQRELDHIAITADWSQKTYFDGDSWDTSSISFKAVFDNDDEETVSLGNEMDISFYEEEQCLTECSTASTGMTSVWAYVLYSGQYGEADGLQEITFPAVSALEATYTRTTPSKTSFTTSDTFIFGGKVIETWNFDPQNPIEYTESDSEVTFELQDSGGTKITDIVSGDSMLVSYDGAYVVVKFNGAQVGNRYSITVEAAVDIQGSYGLVTNLSSLVDNSLVVITNSDGTKAISTTQGGNNRPEQASGISNNLISISSNSTIQVFKIKTYDSNGDKIVSFYACHGSNVGYIYAASSSNNYLRTESTVSDNSKFLVTLGQTFSLTAQGTNTHNKMFYNGTNALFSCYSSKPNGGDNVAIYMKGVTPTTYTVTYDANGGSGTMTDSNSPYNSGATVTTLYNTFTYTGYTFVKWNTQPDGQGTDYEENATFTIAANTTLYAQWEQSGGGGSATSKRCYSLVTSTSDLVAGAKYIIVGHTTTEPYSYYALSTTQNTNNRGQESISVSNTIASVTSDAVEVITLGGSDGAWTFGVTDGYLYAASSSKNYLRTQSTNDANGQWAISIDNNGVVTAEAQGSNSHNLLQYNSGNSLFSAYSSSQQNVYLYKLDFGETLLGNITCDGSGSHTLPTGWTWNTDLQGVYNDLPSSEKTTLASASSAGLARYDYIVGKYNPTLSTDSTQTDYVHFITGRTVTPLNNSRILLGVIMGDNANTVAIIVIISMVSVTAIGGYFFLRKRKENI